MGVGGLVVGGEKLLGKGKDLMASSHTLDPLLTTSVDSVVGGGAPNTLAAAATSFKFLNLKSGGGESTESRNNLDLTAATNVTPFRGGGGDILFNHQSHHQLLNQSSTDDPHNFSQSITANNNNDDSIYAIRGIKIIDGQQ